MKHSAHKNVNLPKFIKMIEGYSFNDNLLAVTISPFSRGNIEDPKAAKNAQGTIERMMGFMFIIAGEVEMSIDYANYTFSVPREKAHTGAAAREQPQDSPVIAR